MTGSRPLRVGFLTQWFEPEPVTNPLWIAAALQEQGLTVGIATGIPNYPDGRVQSPFRAHRRYTGKWHGASVVRTPLYPSHNRSGLGRAVNYLSFAAGSALGAQAILGRSDVNLVYATPATVAIPAMVAAKRSRVPYVLYIQDLWPDSVTQTGMLPQNSFTSWGVAGLTRFVNASYRNASHVVVISPGMLKALTERGVPQAKISVIPNWAAEEPSPSVEDVQAARRTLGLVEDDILVMYAGNHGQAQNLACFIDAIRSVRGFPQLRFAFLGEGSQKEVLQSLATDIPRERLQFLPGVKPHEVAPLVAAADAQIISLADESIFQMTIPGKVQANLAAGKAIIAAASGDAASLLNDSGAAFVVRPGDSLAIAAMLRKLPRLGRRGLEEMGRAGRDFYFQVLGREQGSRRLVKVLEIAARSVAK